MASMIYRLRRNGKRGLGYVLTKPLKIKHNSKQKDTKPKALYSHFTFGNTYDYTAQKPMFRKNLGKLTRKDPKKIWVPKR